MNKYGCFDRPSLRTSVVVANGWFQDGYTRTPRMISIPDPMTKTCNFTTTALGQVDPKCNGCTHKQPPPKPMGTFEAAFAKIFNEIGIQP